ncbi:hypothetical protein [Pseudoalteromonas piscicida]|uniref:hypothetical protein n=1 Tax=Pseudoalteromonas piscicida TaxID=43662 RepID=UPI00155255F3|nr:hypothetical protein [Pseudoalteromonas piscicida]
MKWLEQVAQGKLNGQPVTAEAEEYALDILTKINSKKYKLKPILANVKVPNPGAG